MSYPKLLEYACRLRTEVTNITQILGVLNDSVKRLEARLICTPQARSPEMSDSRTFQCLACTRMRHVVQSLPLHRKSLYSACARKDLCQEDGSCTATHEAILGGGSYPNECGARPQRPLSCVLGAARHAEAWRKRTSKPPCMQSTRSFQVYIRLFGLSFADLSVSTASQVGPSLGENS